MIITWTSKRKRSFKKITSWICSLERLLLEISGILSDKCRRLNFNNYYIENKVWFSFEIEKKLIQSEYSLKLNLDIFFSFSHDLLLGMRNELAQIFTSIFFIRILYFINLSLNMENLIFVYKGPLLLKKLESSKTS